MAIDLPPLVEPHGFRDGIRWRLTPAGIVCAEEAKPKGSGGKPVTVDRIWRTFEGAIRAAATRYEVPVELILATIATESRGNPAAERSEPGFESYERTPNRVSIGLMQTLISTAREALGDPTLDATGLRDPATAILAGTSYIARQQRLTGFDPPKGACAYNAGGLYHQPGEGNRWKMRQFPIGTGAHADRFVAWFNDCFLVFDDLDNAPEPGFVRALRSEPGPERVRPRRRGPAAPT
ncbi:MAG: hypothetical protein EXQ95_04205 [Alphaproteobacteria bacterium]|nr:hypothetical protein [Alphaproteobacteria bacterium]